MKAKKLLPILLIVITLAFYGCKKSNPAPAKVGNLMTFTLQDKKYTVATPYLVTPQGANIVISGASQGGPGLNILIINYQQHANFALYDQAFADFETINSAGYQYTCNKGQLLISSLTQTHISGTFTGTARKNDDTTFQEIPVNGTFDADIPQ
ncbi:hypothetical protein ACPPVU_06710 [Mucilaginibacter sp. McL0603]|uniref:hypothetical protein n=1 Tax=Mucilaginibacter sp. McL0603 TaxID=3415670 RepID=UPI003CF053D6